MLIIAQPKSASGSLSKALSDVIGCPNHQQSRFSWNPEKVGEFNEMPHSDIVYLKKKIMAKWVLSNKVYKQHMAPVRSHKHMINSIGKNFILLLRQPLQSYGGYFRGRYAIEEENFDLGKLRSQVIRWHNRAKKLFECSSYCKVVWFSDLIKSTQSEMNDILNHFGVNDRVSEGYSLPKVRYTGYGHDQVT